MRDQLKDTIIELFDMIGECEDALDLVDLKFEARLEMICYLAYLSSSDGFIDKKEVNIINEYLNERITASGIKDLILKFGINSDSFAETIPKTLCKLVLLDNVLMEGGKMDKCGLSGRWVIVSKVLGIKMILADGNADGDEIFHLMNYIIELERYLDKNLLSRQG